MTARLLALVAVLPAVLVAAGCGGGNATSNPSASTSNTTTATSTAAATSPGALQAEAASAATGDIPDNQVYLAHRSSTWSIKYPEGWAQSGGPNATVFRDKNNIVRIVIHPGAVPTAAQVRSDPSLRQAQISSAPKTMSIKASPAIKVVYTTRSAPNPVTGKRVTLTVDRYYLSRSGKVATIDLGTPVGVDNVDAYRLMIESFRWR
jgi:hypothetical protein